MKKSNTNTSFKIKDELQGERTSFTSLLFISKKRWHSMQLSYQHGNGCGIWTFPVIVQASYTHRQLLMLFFFCKRDHIYISLFILTFSFRALIFIFEVSLWLRKGKWHTLTWIWDNAWRYFMRLMFLIKLCSTQLFELKARLYFESENSHR